MVLYLELVSVAALALAAYAYVFYPAVLQLVCFCAAAFRAPRAKPELPAALNPLPRVAVVFSAYNEQVHIVERIRNLLACDYPPERLMIYVGSDGSSDRTNELLQSFSDPRLKAVCFAANRGKASVLNDLLAQVQEDFVIFTDANTFFAPQAISELVVPFVDPRVAAVVGELRLAASGGNNQDSTYWRLEQRLKLMESRIGALLGANGGIYAIRRAFWVPLPRDTICDDFCIAMQIAAAGGRVVYQPAAWADEDTPDDISDEFHRRLRIGIGNYQALFRYPQFLTRTSWGTRFAYLSHKVLRWLTPHLLILSFVAAGTLYLMGIWRTYFLLQLAAYAAAAVLYALALKGTRLPGMLKIPAFLFALNFAFLVASIRYASGNFAGSWRRTARV